VKCVRERGFVCISRSRARMCDQGMMMHVDWELEGNLYTRCE
jgi:hypothetical protein